MRLNELAQQIEKVSTLYAKRFSINRDSDWFLLKLGEEFGELSKAYLMLTNRTRIPTNDDEPLRSEPSAQEKIAEELADVICHAMLIANHFDINLEEVIAKKWLDKLNG